MQPDKRAIDHLVYCVFDLEKAVEKLSGLFGVAIQKGGKHPDFGTYNALLNLGNGIYLELLAIDPEAKSFEEHWMGIDQLDKPQLTRWAMKSNNLPADMELLANYRPELTKVSGGKRRTTSGELLEWELSVPLSAPRVEPFPFFVDWNDSVHPTRILPEACRLIQLEIAHPETSSLKDYLKQLNPEVNLVFSSTPQIRAQVKTPTGLHWI